MAQMVKRLAAMRETRVRFLRWEDPLKKEMTIQSRTLAWKIPWMEEPDRLQYVGSQRVGRDSIMSAGEIRAVMAVNSAMQETQGPLLPRRLPLHTVRVVPCPADTQPDDR